MSVMKSGTGPHEDNAGSWATESLPMSVRKELLERELNKLGFRRASAQVSSTDSAAAQQHGDSGSSHPQADADHSSEHGE